MKIWSNTAETTRPVMNDCAAPAIAAQAAYLPESAHTLRFWRLAQPSSLYIQPCTDEYWLVSAPTGSGRIAVIDEEALRLLEQFQVHRTILEIAEQDIRWSLESIEKLTTHLLALGFLHRIDQASRNLTPEQADTLTTWLHVTNACNLSCQYCYVKKTSASMSDDTARRAVDAIFRSARLHGYTKVRLKYAGGEATLRTNSVLAIHDYAAAQAQRFGLTLSAHIISNGVVFPIQTIQACKKRDIGISISLDGIGDAHDTQRSFANGQPSFPYVQRTIERLRINGIIPHILVTVSQKSLSGLTDLMQYILKQDLPFSISYYRDNEQAATPQDLQFSDKQMISAMSSVFTLIEQQLPARSLLDALIDKVVLSNTHQHTCGTGRDYLVVNQQGGIAKCQVESQKIVATIADQDPLAAIRSDQTGVQNLASTEKAGCKDCQWRNWCAGGCPILTHRVTGRYDVKSPNCNIYLALIPKALRLEALRLLKYAEPLVIEDNANYVFA